MDDHLQHSHVRTPNKWIQLYYFV